MTRKSVDLATLAGWTSLSDGNHNITIVAKADGYRNSERSSSVVVTKATTPTEDELAGTWVFNETLTWSTAELPEEILRNGGFPDLPFTTYDGTECYSLGLGDIDDNTEPHTVLWFGDTEVYGLVSDADIGELIWRWYDGWTEERNRTITINATLNEYVFGEVLLKFLSYTATKQGGATIISFTIGDNSYQAEEGMTWAQWVDSSYNTSYMNLGTWIGNQLGQSVAIKSGKFATDVRPSDTIQASAAYVLQTGASSPN